MKASLSSFGTSPESMEFRNIMNSGSLNCVAHSLSKSAEKPSGPGAEFALISEIDLTMSSFVKLKSDRVGEDSS